MDSNPADGYQSTAQPITRYGQAVLHRPCAPVTMFGPELAALVDDMFASMRAADGVGLAANQIGVDLRVFVYDCPDATGGRQAGHVVNPVLRVPKALAPPMTEAEGCLSVPGQHAMITRPALAAVTGLDVRGPAGHRHRDRDAGPVPSARGRPSRRDRVPGPAPGSRARRHPGCCGPGSPGPGLTKMTVTGNEVL